MANALTGEFDVVAEFTVLAVNRILAAMHKSGRFLHSISARLDDDPPPGLHGTAVGSVNVFGEATANQERIVRMPATGGLIGTAAALVLDPIVNTHFGGTIGPIEPSHLKGRAQLQLFPPKIVVTDGAGKSVTVKVEAMSRYFPDAGTARIAEFIRGELQITAAVNQVVLQAANVIDVDFKASQAIINFVPTWSSQALGAQDIAGIDLLIRNTLKANFLPSNTTLPPQIRFLQIKTLKANPDSVAVLLNLSRPTTDASGAVIPPASSGGNPATMNSVFVGGSDQFALAISKQFLVFALQPSLDNIKSQFPQNTTITSPWGTHATYTISVNSVTADLQNGKIVITLKGHAHEDTSKWWAPNAFDFTATLPFQLSASGSSASLVALDDVGFDSTSTLVNWFSGAITGSIKQMRDNALSQSGADQFVRQMLDVNSNLGNLLNSLVAVPPKLPIFQLPPLHLEYSSAEIRADGIVLHGSIAVTTGRLVATAGTGGGAGVSTGWPPAHVEFEQIPSNAGTSIAGGVLAHGPDYSALKSWIPGGTIDRYEWGTLGQPQPFFTDEHKFVLLGSGPEVATEAAASATVVHPFSRMCLTVRGTRISASGAVGDQPVSAAFCAFKKISVVPGALSGVGDAMLMVALTEPGPSGNVHVLGHAQARPDTEGRGTPNLVIHFASGGADHLEQILRAVNGRKNQDAAAAVLAVLTPEQMTKARYTPGAIYAEEQNQAWARTFKVGGDKRPTTLIVTPEGKTVWRHDGELEKEEFSAALQHHLVRCGMGWSGYVRSNARVGQLAPNFLFEYAPGRELALRKLAGKPVMLIFWNRASRASFEAVQGLGKEFGKGESAVVLAIHEGESAEVAKSRDESSVVWVADEQGEIARAYGVEVWPTIISLDSSGAVFAIEFRDACFSRPCGGTSKIAH